MAVPSSLVDLSTTAASNSPAGSESIGTSLDDYLRAVQAIIKQGVSKGSDIASASTITPVATSAYFVVTGTTGITAIGETYSWTGRIVVLKFSGALLLTHSSGLLLPGAANITTVAGDVLAFVNESAGVWRCVFGNNALLLTGGTMTGALIFKAGLNNKASAATVDITSLGANTAHITGTTGIGAWTMTSGQVADVVFDAAPLLGHHATTFNLPGGANILAAAGDRMRLWYDGTTVWCVSYQRADGTQVAPAVVSSKTTAYTLVNADRGKTIALGGAASYALTVGVVGGFDSTFKARIKNTDTARAKKMTISGITDFWLWPGQFIDLYISGGAWQVDGAPARWVTQNAGVTFYVSHAAGSNSNDGLAAGAGNALATIQEAIYRIERYIDCTGNGPTIQVADGTFTENDVSHTKRIHGNHVIYLAGNVTTPGNCVWQMTAGHSGITCRDWSGMIISGFKFVALGVGCTAIASSQHGVVDIGTVEFGDMTGGVCIAADNGGSIGYTIGATSKFLGNASVLWAVTTGSNLIVTGCTINLSAITFTTGLSHTGGCSTWAGVTFTGAGAGAGSTGTKYGIALNGIAILNGTTLPGASAGVTTTGGQVSP